MLQLIAVGNIVNTIYEADKLTGLNEIPILDVTPDSSHYNLLSDVEQQVFLMILEEKKIISVHKKNPTNQCYPAVQ